MIKDDIQKSMYESLKNGQQTELKVLRFSLSQIQYEEIDKQKELTDDEVIALLQKEIKKRKEAIEMFKKGNRNDLVTDEEKQIVVIGKFLPQQLSEEELKKIIDEVMSASPGEKNLGKIIGLVMGKTKGRTDGSIIAKLVKQKLELQ